MGNLLPALARRVFRLGALIAAALLLALMPPAAATADGPEALSGCSSLSKAIERADRSIVAIGETSGCNQHLAPPGWMFLLGVGPGGDLLPEFGDGGVVRLPDGASSLLLSRPDGGVIVDSGGALVSYERDGRPDSSFGDGGRLIRPEMGQALIGPDQKLYLAWGQADRVLERFEMDGSPDASFGSGGRIEIDFPFDGGVGPAVDSQGRIYLVDGFTAIRLLPDGSPDPGFGPDGNGRLALDVNPAPPGFYFPVQIKKVEIGPGDSFYAFGRGSENLYTNRSFVTGVDPAGDLLPGLPDLMNTEDIGSVSLYGGGVAYTEPPGRWDTDFPFNVRATAWNDPLRVFLTDSQSPAWANGTTPLADGSLLTVGGTSGVICPPGRCRTGTRAALVKASASGSLMPTFGAGGKVVIPGDRCEWGKVDGKGDWDSCRLRPPHIRASVELRGSRHSRPWLFVEAGLGSVPARLGEGRQAVSLALPGWLKVKSARLLRRTKVRALPGGHPKVVVQGRKLKATVQGSKTTRFRIRLLPGAVKLRGKVRKINGRKLRLRAAFMPLAGSLDSPGVSTAALPVKTS